MNRTTRREFLKRSTAAAVGMGMLGATPALLPANVRKVPRSAQDEVVVGFIGIAGRGGHLLNEFMQLGDVRVGAVCDVYRAHRERAAAQARDATGDDPHQYEDFRELLAQPDIDAVVIATPPHWHGLIAVEACRAGKDLYCEKPMATHVAEVRAMRDAVVRYDRISQVGTQIHATDNYRRAVEIVQSGVLGPISCVRTYLTMNEAPAGIGNTPDSEPPDGLNWDFWCGPSPLVPFNIERFQAGQHRYFKEYVGSWLHEMGPHIIDLAFWAMQAGPPRAVSASGGKWVTHDMSTIPDTLDAIFEFPEFNMTWMNTCGNGYHFNYGEPPDGAGGRRLGVLFQGLNATLMADYGTHEVFAEGSRMDPSALPEPAFTRSPGHQREFIDGVKSRERPPASIEYHYPLHIALALAHISLDVGRKVHWDDEAGEITGDAEANALATPDYRAPWQLPRIE